MRNKKRNIAGYIVLFAGALMMILGIVQGEYRDVFEKAIRICLECIGIG